MSLLDDMLVSLNDKIMCVRMTNVSHLDQQIKCESTSVSPKLIKCESELTIVGHLDQQSVSQLCRQCESIKH